MVFTVGGARGRSRPNPPSRPAREGTDPQQVDTLRSEGRFSTPQNCLVAPSSRTPASDESPSRRADRSGARLRKEPPMTATFDLPAQTTSSTTPSSTISVPASSTAVGDADVVRKVSRFRRRAMAVGIGVGAAFTFAGFATTNWEGSSDKAAYLNSLTEHPLQTQIAAVFLHFGYMGFLPMLLALGMFARRRAVKLGHVGLGLGLLGALSLPGLLVTDFYDLAIRQHLPIDKAIEV